MARIFSPHTPLPQLAITGAATAPTLLLQAGGTPAVLKYLLQHNLIDGSTLTVTGRTLGENLEACPGLKEGQQVRGGGMGVVWRVGGGRREVCGRPLGEWAAAGEARGAGGGCQQHHPG